jgi:maltose alpha-D-glucosyltransferase/alpha-amylase
VKRERISTGFPPDPTWYKDAVIYEAHVRAFMDSSGDGIGDFAGLTSRLDHLEDLGVTAIWLLPFYPSPLRDDGYDIADYLAVHPDYGTMRDARTFIREAHRRGLRVITELVFNHTSDQHAWFKRARRARPGSPDRDWYVWSDTPDRYRDVRIIFKDFEASNWTWDPVAGAYYWHRFYSHQPDLNYDNPKVQDALIRITDFWLEAGVDGLRLDAIPYLYEREGTNGENLPETHAFLRRLRRHIDERFADRMLLAEANQWPEDSVAYFGDGDECHMEFHFPLMPRMFMALRLEDRFPILDILAQTPDIPENAQWALFLRNHDELTLEMVTDEERDYMYRVYAADPQARLNLGIRRRLAPLLGNNRRRIELMNGLMLSLPGTPVIYYGDEIGMGDNVYLGDRNGVRTPMQWSSDRNAGFSSANRQRLYLPVITDPEYHYEAVNVEAQQANPQSLYWWMKRLIALRKRHPAFGRGTLQFLQPDNRKILAFVREHEGETLLVVANLSRYAQWTELGLEAWEGRVPVELFGQASFPRISASPWLISLGPHSFLWFRLTTDVLTDAFTPVGRAELPTLRWKGSLGRLLDEADEVVASVLTTWMQPRRWYRGKARTVRTGHLHDVIPLGTRGHESVLALVQVEYVEDEPELYVLPLTVERDGDMEPILTESPQAAIAWLDDSQGGRTRLVDGALVPETCEALLAIVARRRTVQGGRTSLQGRSDRALRDAAGIAIGALTASPQRVEQSNSSAFFDERLVLKLYRTIEGGPNPDLELTRYLSDNGFRNVPPVLGAIDMHGLRTRPAMDATVAMVQAYVAHEGNLWDVLRDAADAYLDAAEAEGAPPDLASDAGLSLLDLSRRDPPPEAHRLIGASLETARVLGDRIGRMHAVLAAADPTDAAMAPETLTPFIVRSLYQGIRTGVRDSLSLLASRRTSLSEPDGVLAAEVLAASDEVERRLRKLLETRIGGQRIRVHGDLHLGQVLDTGNDVMIIDLEGEPARPLGERRLKRPALTDLAGMVRSFDYAAHAPLIGTEGAGGRAGEAGSLAAWSRFWSRWMSVACVTGYREATGDAAFLPSDDTGWTVLLEALLVAKAAYELRYELGSRPDWVGIALVGFRDLLVAGS